MRRLLPFLLLLPAVSLRAQQVFSAPEDSTRNAALQEVVVTGVSAPVKLQNALSLYRVIDEKQFRAQGAVTVSEALNTQLGLQTGNDPVLGTSVQVQGLRSDKVKILIDGLPVNGRENGSVDLGQLNLARIARIEVVQGPMSVVYGSDALGGVINLITKKNFRKQLQARFFTESVGRYNVDATAGWQLGTRHHLDLTAGRNFFDGWGDLDTVMPQRRLLYKPKTQYFTTLGYGYRAPSGFQLTAASDFFQEKVTNLGTAYIDPYRAYGLDQHFRVLRSMNRVQLEGKAGAKGRWMASNSYNYYHRIRESVEKDLVSLTESPTLAQGDQDTSRFDDITLRSNYSRPVGPFYFDGGYDVNLQSGRSNKLGTSTTDQYRQQDYALYANASYRFWKERATFQAGLRGSYNSLYATPLVPAANLLLKPSEKIQVRASYAEGFRAPTLKELYLQFIDQNHEIIGNPELAPERSHNYQFSVSSQYAVGKSVHMNSVLSTAYNDVRNGITLVNPTGDSTSLRRMYSNMSRQQTATLQLQTEAAWKTLRLIGGYGITRILGQEGAYESFNLPEGTASLFWFIPKAGISFNAFYKYTGPSRMLVADMEGNAIYGSGIRAFHMLDVSAQRSFWKKRLALVAGIKNVFDVQALSGGSTGGGVHSSGGAAQPLPRRFFAQVILSPFADR